MESNHQNLDSNHEEVAPLFEQFPSPFFDDMLYNHHKHTTSNTANEPPPSPAKTKRVRKKRSPGKNDRHSKIHTAQGLRDRRMRLSVNIARKFFGLQDMLGFDKASKTIEWLFCKSKEAIDEVTESVKPQNTTLSGCESPFTDCEVDSGIEFDASSNKGKQLMTNNLEKSKHVIRAKPNDDVNQLLLGFSSNPNNHFLKDSSSSLLEYPGMHHDHFIEHTQLYDVGKIMQDYTGNAAASLTTYFANPPDVGWLDSSNPFSGFLGGLDSDNFTDNYELNFPNLAPSTGDVNGQNFGSVLIPPSNLVYLQTQNQRD